MWAQRQDTVSVDRLKVAYVDYPLLHSSDAPFVITPTTVHTRSGRQVRFNLWYFVFTGGGSTVAVQVPSNYYYIGV